MSQNQSGIQAAVRAQTGTAYNWTGDFHALFDKDGIASGPFNQRLLLWINAALGENYTNLNGAMNAYAVSLGFANWNSLNTWGSLTPPYDPNAAAYFAVSGTDAAPYTTGINAAIVAMKAAGLWDKADRIWMFAGQNEAGSLIDWKALNADAETVNDPDWAAGVGFTLNGTSQYIDTNAPRNAFTNFQRNAGSYGVDVETSDTGSRCIMGVRGASNTPPSTQLFYSGTNIIMEVNGAGTGGVFVGPHGGRSGFWLPSRTGATATGCYKDGSSIGNGTDPTTALDANSFFIGALADGSSALVPCSGDYRFAWIGGALDATEAAALAAIRQTLGETIGWL